MVGLISQSFSHFKAKRFCNALEQTEKDIVVVLFDFCHNRLSRDHLHLIIVQHFLLLIDLLNSGHSLSGLDEFNFLFLLCIVAEL